MVAAVARGFLVRNRRFHLTAKVIFIQRRVRVWQRKSPAFRAQAFENMRQRKAKASKIQDAFRKHAEKKEIDRIQQREEAPNAEEVNDVLDKLTDEEDDVDQPLSEQK